MWLLRAAEPLWQQLPKDALSKEFLFLRCSYSWCCRTNAKSEMGKWSWRSSGGWSSSLVGRKPRATAALLLLGQTFEKAATIPVCGGNQPDWRQSSYLQLDQSLFLYITFPRGMFRWDAALHFYRDSFLLTQFWSSLKSDRVTCPGQSEEFDLSKRNFNSCMLQPCSISLACEVYFSWVVAEKQGLRNRKNLIFK